MTTATLTHAQILKQRIDTEEATTGINREQALKLQEIVEWDSDGHECAGWDQLQQKIHDAGFSTIVFPLADGKSYNRNTKNFTMHWAMVDRGSSNYGPCQGKLMSDRGALTGTDEKPEQILPIYCYGSLKPVQFYVRDWMSMNLEDVGYVASADPIQVLLATQTKRSDKGGWGSRAAENYSFWADDFNNEWPEGTDRVIKPSLSLPIARLKFYHVFLQPETRRFKEAWDKDESTNQEANS